jgi:hypothetical protein
VTSIREEIRAAREETREDMIRLHGRLDDLEVKVQALRENHSWAKGVWAAVVTVGGAAFALAGWLLRVWPLGFLFLAGCVAGPYGAESKWPQALRPVVVRIDSAMSPACLEAARVAFRYWNSIADYLRLEEVPNPGRPQWGEIRVHEGDLKEPDWIGGTNRHTATALEPDGILHADVTLGCGCTVRANVLAAHELGHALGLTHSPDPYALMYEAPAHWALTDEEWWWVQ